MNAPLQRVQISKGWIDAEGKTHEKVGDIVCADCLEVEPNTLRCPTTGLQSISKRVSSRETAARCS
jgi:hypothetical protein